MIVVMEHDATADEIDAMVAELERRRLKVRRLEIQGRALLHIIGGRSAKARHVRKMDGFDALVPTSGPRYRRFGQRFYPHLVVRWCAVAVVLLGLLTFLAGQYPPGIGAPVDVQNAPAQLDVSWYMRPFLMLVDLLPSSLSWLGWLAIALVVAALIALPQLSRLERGASTGGSR